MPRNSESEPKKAAMRPEIVQPQARGLDKARPPADEQQFAAKPGKTAPSTPPRIRDSGRKT